MHLRVYKVFLVLLECAERSSVASYLHIFVEYSADHGKAAILQLLLQHPLYGNFKISLVDMNYTLCLSEGFYYERGEPNRATVLRGGTLSWTERRVRAIRVSVYQLALVSCIAKSKLIQCTITHIL